MNDEQRLRDSIRSYASTIEPSEEGWARIQSKLSRRGGDTFHRLVMVAVVLGLGATAFVTALIVKSNPVDRLRVLAPTSSTPSPSPSSTITPEASPTASPSPPTSPPGQTLQTSTDGSWRLWFPSDWHLKDVEVASSDKVTVDEWFIRNYETGKDFVQPSEGVVKVDFAIRKNQDSKTLDDLLQEVCKPPLKPEIDKVVECKQVTIQGRAWAWAVFHEDVSGGITDLFAATVANDNVYTAIGFVPDGEKASKGLDAAKKLFDTFSIS